MHRTMVVADGRTGECQFVISGMERDLLELESAVERLGLRHVLSNVRSYFIDGRVHFCGEYTDPNKIGIATNTVLPQ